MYKKVWCMCRVVVLLIKPIVFFSRSRYRPRCWIFYNKVPIMCLLFKVKLRPFQFSLGIYKIMQRPDKPFLQGMYLKIFLTLMAWTLMTRWNFWSPLKILLMRSGNRKITSLILRHA